MQSGGADGSPMFRPADIGLFKQANPEHVIASPCTEVMRTAPVAGVSSCACASAFDDHDLALPGGGERDLGDIVDRERRAR